MADLDKLYEMTVENNTNIKYVMKTIESHDQRLDIVEDKGKGTAKEHLISFGKVCGALLIVGSFFTFIVKMSGKLWQ